MFNFQEEYLESLLSLELDNNNNPEYVVLHKDTNPFSMTFTELSNDEIEQQPEIIEPPTIIYPQNYINSLTNQIKTTDDYILQFYFGSITVVVLLLYFRMLQHSK